MNVLPCGSKVRTVIADIEGVITAIRITGSAVDYRISYFYQGEYKEEYLSECEFICRAPSIKIGFKRIT